MRIPDTIESIDAEWLSGALGAPVESFSVEPLEGGVLALAYRIGGIRYAPNGRGSAGPDSVVLKIATNVADQRAMAATSGLYAREFTFFRDLASEVPLRSPHLHHAASDGSPDCERFVLVMEDLARHSRVFDQVHDNPDEYFARRTALEVAEMHARFWRSPRLEQPPIRGADRYTFPMEAACRDAPSRIDEFEATWRALFGRDVYRDEGAPGTKALTELVCGPGGLAVQDRILDVLSGRPRTLLHGDLRADNIFRTRPDAVSPPEEARLTYIDWQLIGAGPPGPEFSQAWLTSLPPAVRRRDTSMLRAYHDRLVERAPAAAEYPFETLVEDYVLGGVLWWAALVTIGANALSEQAQPSERMQRLWSQCLPWLLTAFEEHDALGRLRAILERA